MRIRDWSSDVCSSDLGKLVRVTQGEVFDVAVDIRRSSTTFGRWVGARLSAAIKAMLWVPPGFAHGFCVLSEAADFLYKCTDFYAEQHERSSRWDRSEETTAEHQ